jgi:hypothetical protein
MWVLANRPASTKGSLAAKSSAAARSATSMIRIDPSCWPLPSSSAPPDLMQLMTASRYTRCFGRTDCRSPKLFGLSRRITEKSMRGFLSIGRLPQHGNGDRPGAVNAIDSASLRKDIVHSHASACDRLVSSLPYRERDPRYNERKRSDLREQQRLPQRDR